MNMTELNNNSCNEPHWYSYISYALNLFLLATTVISEYMGHSKCKSNGIVDGIKRSVSGIPDVLPTKEAKDKKTIFDNTELIFSLFEKFQEFNKQRVDALI
tara:strand:- start:43 stop:345 length:303 start_codon:yes stop_codon:yes gene_type:complete